MYSFLRSNLTTRHIRNGGWLLKLPFSKKKKKKKEKKNEKSLNKKGNSTSKEVIKTCTHQSSKVS